MAELGRPLKFKTVKELQKKIDEYFAERDSKRLPYTVSGLALALDTNRQTLLEYQGEVAGREKKDPGYADTIKRAKLKCEEYAESMLYLGKNAAGPIFNLKNNYGWKDEKQLKQTGDFTHHLADLPDDELQRLAAEGEG